MHILVIDNDAAIATALEACGQRMATVVQPQFYLAHDNAAALELLRSRQEFDLALINVDDDSHAGLSIFKQLSEPSRRFPRVALTASHDVAAVKQALAEGAVDLLTKPLDADDFCATIERVKLQVEQRRQNWHERGAYMALRREVDIAADMQRRILPQGFPSESGLDFAAMMEPARGVGGDFYDVFRINDRQIGFLIADVSGKGIPAAFYMAVASTTLRAVAMRGASPGQCLAEVNSYLVGRNIPGMFVSVFYAVIDTETWQVRCSNAGHGAPLMRHSVVTESIALTSEGGPVLGILDDLEYPESSFEMPPGACVLLYTDGISEAYNATREQFGETRLNAMFSANACSKASGLLQAVEQGISDFTIDTEQHDDMTAMAVRRCA